MSRLIVLLIISLFLTSCGMSENDVKKMVEKTKQLNVSKIEALPTLKEYFPINYESDKLNDPFDIPAGKLIARKNNQQLEIKMQSQKPDYARPREYLENYPLDSLVMVGTLKKRGEMWGLIVDRAGIIHKVKAGNYLGQNSGKIKKITENNMDIDEIISDGQGGWTGRDVNLGIKH